MLKKFIIFFSILTISFSVTKVHALSFDFDDKKFSQLTFDELMEYEYSFINSNYDKVFCVQMSNIYLDCFFGLKGYDLVVNTESSNLRVRNVYNGSTDSHVPYIRVNNGSTSPLVKNTPFVSFQSTTTNISGKTVVYSNFDVYDFSNNSLYFSKNVDFSPPTCEVCEECEECENMNFPISHDEFYILLVLLSVIILLIFFKWTFGDRRRH